MKSIFIAGSRKFYDEIEKLVESLNENGVRAETAGKSEKKEDTPESEKKALLSAFGKIREADTVYVYAKGGYAGKTVCMEIAFAYSLGKEIISSEILSDFSARSLVSKVIPPEEIIKHPKDK